MKALGNTLSGKIELEVSSTLLKAYANAGNYRQLYSSLSKLPEVVTRYSQSHAVTVAIIDLNKRYGRQSSILSIIFKVLSEQLLPEAPTGVGLYKPKTKDRGSLYNLLSKLRREPDLENAIVQYVVESRGKGNLTRKAPNEAFNLLRHYYSGAEGGHYSYLRISEEINKSLEAESIQFSVTESWVKKHVKAIKDLYVLDREGKGQYWNKVKTPQYRDRPPTTLSRVEIDGSRFSLPVWDNVEKAAYYMTYFLVVDSCSKRILGWSFDISENHLMVRRALEMCARNVGGLPRQIVTDNGPAYKQLRKNTFEKLKKYGVLIDSDKTQNPRGSKPTGESSQNRLQKILREHPGFLGQGIKTKSMRPAEQVSFLTRRVNSYTPEAAKQILEEAIESYNNRKLRKLGRDRAINKSPNEIYDSTASNLIPLQNYEIPILFQDVRTLKISQGLVKFDVKKYERIYELNNASDKVKWNSRLVNVYYDADDDREIIVCDARTDEYLFTCKHQLAYQIAVVHQTESDKQIIGDRHKRNILESKQRAEAAFNPAKNYIFANTPLHTLPKGDEARAFRAFVNGHHPVNAVTTKIVELDANISHELVEKPRATGTGAFLIPLSNSLSQNIDSEQEREDNGHKYIPWFAKD